MRISDWSSDVCSSDLETLISRLIDRPIRPLFPDGFRNEVQIIATVMSMNPEVDGDVLALIGASAALSLSGAPFGGPIGAAKVGYKDGQYLLNPTKAELRSEEHTSELQSLMRISYAVFCLQKKNKTKTSTKTH